MKINTNPPPVTQAKPRKLLAMGRSIPKPECPKGLKRDRG